MSNSEDDAYDPWPGATMTRTGCHCQTYYTTEYRLSAPLCRFFDLDIDIELTEEGIDNLIIGYAEKHNGVDEHKNTIHYDAALWELLGIPKEKPFKYYHIWRVLEKFITRILDRKHDWYKINQNNLFFSTYIG